MFVLHQLSLVMSFLNYEHSFLVGTRFAWPKTSLHASPSYNPNDNETPEERNARMELVRQIQANFYQSDETMNDNGDEDSRWLLKDPNNPTVLYNVPLWRVQWTELPGYQNVLNVHVAHYTHMFRKLLLQHPRPWYFGHVFLPGGSENLGNPEYFLPEKEARDDDPIPSEEELMRQDKVTLTGTLMQVTDYLEQEDGRLTLIVQGIGRIKILEASQQVPYAIASKIKLLSDQECWEEHYLQSMGNTPADYELSMAYMDASQALAAKESELLRDLEFFQTVAEQPSESEDKMTIAGVSPLSNVNGSVAVDFDEVEVQLQEAFSKAFSQKAEEYGSDDILLASTTLQLKDASAYEEDVVLDERAVWIKLDEMINLLGKAQPGLRIPVPAQLLGLLPIDTDWPKGFRLQGYAEQLEDNQARVGTYSRSPFVRLSKAYPRYPPLRRASRLSYAIWLLLDTIASVGDERFSREELLETASITKRLKRTIHQLEIINEAIQRMIGE